MNRYATTLASVFFIIMGVLGIYFARQFPSTMAEEVGPAFYPTVLSCLLILLSILLMAKERRENKETSESKEAHVINWKISLAGLLLTSVYFFLIYLAGFYVASPLYFVAMKWMIDGQRKWTAIVPAVAVTAGIYVVFALLLNVILPTGALFS
ncbi:tripartite tricarboxylate transporter TctB family protein [Brevibacillus sp. B_LB10_24]|uniref:tripartite tricarboxylate transporter TctB family protein n=1 Tax=Brevibacillus sp. B_LB10_24 TaxID=3380645 RepID=UPI0038BB2DFA